MQREEPERFPWSDVYCLAAQEGALRTAAYRSLLTVSPLSSWTRRERIDLLHAHFGQTAVWPAADHRELPPLVLSYYGRDVTLGTRRDLDLTAWRYLHYRPRIFALARKVIVLSRHMADALAAQGCPREKLVVIRLGCDLQRFSPPPTRTPTRFDVLMVGRMIEKKGFADGLAAFARFRERLPAETRTTVSLSLVGSGPLEQELRRTAEHLGPSIRFLPPRSDVAALMREHHVLLAPSKTARDGDAEGTPTVICEGSACGLPIVATLHAGIPEQVEHGRTGLLSAEGEVSALADNLWALHADPGLRSAMGEAGREKMETEYHPAIEADHLAALYREVLAGN